MLKSLTRTDVETIIAACGPEEPVSTAEADAADATAGRERIYEMVERLPREAQEELLALMWTGGPKNGTSFTENLELARKTWDENHATHIAEQHARLPNYLRDGLRRISAEQA